MESVKKQIADFLDKCDQLKNCKFIMATTKIKDLLKSIVNSPELYELFKTVTNDFDYLEAKRQCLVDSNDGIVNKSYIILPETMGNRLAFIFCLLVEFDKDTMNFNNFLQRYFAEDGSYYSSYHAFCDTVIASLEQMIREIFANEIAQPATPNGGMENDQTDELVHTYISAISVMIFQEKQFIQESLLPDEDKQAGMKMLDEILNAVKEYKASTIDALVCGYNYYIMYNNCISPNVHMLFEDISRYEEMVCA